MNWSRNFVFFVALSVIVGGSLAQEITPIGEINQVDEQGNPTFLGLDTMDTYTIEGYVLNEPGIFNGMNDEGELDTSFILYMQDETGGIQVYSGAWYGGGISAYRTDLFPGDLIRVTGLTGHYGGKTNMNERHNPDLKFEIEVLERDTGELEPIEITRLEGLDAFDPTRESGGEYYQGRLVELKNVEIIEGEWETGEKITVADTEGNTFPVELRAATEITEHPQPQDLLNITGVFNQEDTEPPFTEGYLLWPRSIEDFQPAESTGIECWDVF